MTLNCHREFEGWRSKTMSKIFSPAYEYPTNSIIIKARIRQHNLMDKCGLILYLLVQQIQIMSHSKKEYFCRKGLLEQTQLLNQHTYRIFEHGFYSL